MPPAVTVVIPVRDDAKGLPDAVQSVLDQSGGYDLEILLSVGPSSDGSESVAASLAREHPQIRVLDNAHGGIPQALNLGLREAAGRVLVRLDARCALPPDYITSALATLTARRAANVGARQLPVGDTATQRAIAAAMRHRLGSGGADYRHGGQVRRVDTAFLGVFDIEALREAGGWNDEFRRNEDAELNARLSVLPSRNGVWLDPALAVEYRPRSKLRGLWRQYFDYGWWRRRTIAMHPDSLATRQLVAPAIVVVLAASTLLGRTMPMIRFVPVGYAAMVVVAAAREDTLSFEERGRMAAALATMHVGWGSGFLASTIDLLRRRATRRSRS